MKQFIDLKNLKIGDLVEIEESYDEDFHTIPLSRKYIGWITHINIWHGYINLEISNRELLNVKSYQKNIASNTFIQSLKNYPKHIGLSFFNKPKYFNELSIKSIKKIK